MFTFEDAKEIMKPIKSPFEKFRQEMIDLVLDDVPHQYQQRLLEKLNEKIS